MNVMKKIILWILFFISLTTLTLRFGNQVFNTILGTYEKSGIRILSTPTEAKVSLDGKEVGRTPFEDSSLSAREYEIKVDGDGASWQGRVKLKGGTLTVINRELAKSSTTSAGEILSLEKGSGISVLSNPDGSEVEIDGQSVGKSPGHFQVDPGEHIVNLSRDNYLKRSVRALLPDKYQLTLSVDLGLSEADLSTTTTQVTTEISKVVVKNTPTGFLRVRDNPSLVGKEIARVSPGDELTLLDEQASWDKVRLSNEVEGFVSKTYVEKKSQ